MTTTADPSVETPGFAVKDFVDAKQLKEDLAFSPNDLTTPMIQQASLFAHYGTLHADAQRQVDVVKLMLENAEAAVYKATRMDLADKGEKFTEPLLNTHVSRHPRVIQMKKALAQAKRVESITKTAVEAFRHRRDMLVQQGLISREELKGEVRIAERSAHASARETAQEVQKESVLQRLRNRREANEN